MKINIYSFIFYQPSAQRKKFLCQQSAVIDNLTYDVVRNPNIPFSRSNHSRPMETPFNHTTHFHSTTGR